METICNTTTESLEAVRDKIIAWFRARLIPQTVSIDHNKRAFVFGLFRQLTTESLTGIERDLGYSFEECDYYDEDRGWIFVYLLK